MNGHSLWTISCVFPPCFSTWRPLETTGRTVLQTVLRQLQEWGRMTFLNSCLLRPLLDVQVILYFSLLLFQLPSSYSSPFIYLWNNDVEKMQRTTWPKEMNASHGPFYEFKERRLLPSTTTTACELEYSELLYQLLEQTSISSNIGENCVRQICKRLLIETKGKRKHHLEECLLVYLLVKWVEKLWVGESLRSLLFSASSSSKRRIDSRFPCLDNDASWDIKSLNSADDSQIRGRCCL